MGKYSCEKCAKSFSQKSHYDKHLTRKTSCEIQTDKIKVLIYKVIEEKLISNNTKNNIIINTQQQMTTIPEEAIKFHINSKPTDTLDYSKKTLNELIAICKEKKIKGYNGKKKSDIILMISSQAENIIVSEIKETNEIILTSDEEIQKNTFYIGDNIELLKKVKSEIIDMIYLDPPYNTGRNFHYFQDKFADFPKFMEERILECHRILKKNGNIIIHVEPRISHHIRFICDKIFGDSNFQNEIFKILYQQKKK